MSDKTYPECEKYSKLADRISEVRDFVFEGGGLLCEYRKFDEWRDKRLSELSDNQIEDLLMKHFGINRQKLNAEREEMLADIQKGQ